MGKNPDALSAGWGSGGGGKAYLVGVAACVYLATLFLCISAAGGLTSEPGTLMQFPWAYAYQTNQRPYQDEFVENTVVYFGGAYLYQQSSDLSLNAKIEESAAANGGFGYDLLPEDGPCTSMGLEGCITFGIVGLVKRCLVRHVICMPAMERVAITLTMPHQHPHVYVCDFLLTFSVRINHVCPNACAHVAHVQLGAA